MKAYAECNNADNSSLGTDRIIKLDGRNNIENMKNTCKNHIKRMRYIHAYTSFTIYKNNTMYTYKV